MNPASYRSAAASAAARHFCPRTSQQRLLEPDARRRARPALKGGRNAGRRAAYPLHGGFWTCGDQPDPPWMFSVLDEPNSVATAQAENVSSFQQTWCSWTFGLRDSSGVSGP